MNVVALYVFGAGIDMKSVRFVVHVEGSSSVIDYIQETGRAGRDGDHAECMLFVNQHAQEELSRKMPPAMRDITYQNDATDHGIEAGRIELAKLLLSDDCIRKSLQSKVDMDPRSCIEYGKNTRLCDFWGSVRCPK